MSHILNAQLIWNARVDGTPPRWTAWMIHEVVEMKKTNEMGYEWSMKLMANAAPNLIIKYKNTEGSEFSSAAQDVMLHIVNHATYHRGQLAARFKELDIEPPVSDLIHFQKTY
ncbi:MAG: DinB family protein [Bacteroidia bacterium]